MSVWHFKVTVQMRNSPIISPIMRKRLSAIVLECSMKGVLEKQSRDMSEQTLTTTKK